MPFPWLFRYFQNHMKSSDVRYRFPQIQISFQLTVVFNLNRFTCTVNQLLQTDSVSWRGKAKLREENLHQTRVVHRRRHHNTQISSLDVYCGFDPCTTVFQKYIYFGHSCIGETHIWFCYYHVWKKLNVYNENICRNVYLQLHQWSVIVDILSTIIVIVDILSTTVDIQVYTFSCCRLIRLQQRKL